MVVEAGINIKALSSTHQGIERTIAHDTLFLLQARPLTGFRSPAKSSFSTHPDSPENISTQTNNGARHMIRIIVLLPAIAAPTAP